METLRQRQQVVQLAYESTVLPISLLLLSLFPLRLQFFSRFGTNHDVANGERSLLPHLPLGLDRVDHDVAILQNNSPLLVTSDALARKRHNGGVFHRTHSLHLVVRGEQNANALRIGACLLNRVASENPSSTLTAGSVIRQSNACTGWSTKRVRGVGEGFWLFIVVLFIQAILGSYSSTHDSKPTPRSSPFSCLHNHGLSMDADKEPSLSLPFETGGMSLHTQRYINCQRESHSSKTYRIL